MLMLALLLGGLVLLVSSDAAHQRLTWVLEATTPLISAHPIRGAVLFVAFSALSAMLAFFSSAVLVPVAVQTWGELGTVVLLWLGWILGGSCAYGLARAWGRSVIRFLTSERALARHDARFSPQTPFGLVLLFQLAVPSELPGYVLGLARYPFSRYLAVVAIAELPYAIGAVFLGASVLNRRLGLLLTLGAFAILVSALALRMLRKRVAPPPPPPVQTRAHGAQRASRPPADPRRSFAREERG